jgi:hypothetical protein
MTRPLPPLATVSGPSQSLSGLLRATTAPPVCGLPFAKGPAVVSVSPPPSLPVIFELRVRVMVWLVAPRNAPPA